MSQDPRSVAFGSDDKPSQPDPGAAARLEDIEDHLREFEGGALFSADDVEFLLASHKRVSQALIDAVARAEAAEAENKRLREAMAFQSRVQPWMMACFGPEISSDRMERNHRFIEEALELVQACGATADECRQLVDYVYGRPVGDQDQEVGGVMVTLAALCLAHGMDMHAAGERELARIWTMVEKIRAKQAAKPKHSPLPEGPTDAR